MRVFKYIKRLFSPLGMAEETKFAAKEAAAKAGEFWKIYKKLSEKGLSQEQVASLKKSQGEVAKQLLKATGKTLKKGAFTTAGGLTYYTIGKGGYRFAKRKLSGGQEW